MTREYKFRAWDGEKMHYNVVPWRWDFVIDTTSHKCVESTGTGLFGSGGKTAKMEVPAIRFKELMQFTGLKDKNGKEIYEGDLLLSSINAKYSVSFLNGRFQTSDGFHLHLEMAKRCEIIGSVFENPDVKVVKRI